MVAIWLSLADFIANDPRSLAMVAASFGSAAARLSVAASTRATGGASPATTISGTPPIGRNRTEPGVEGGSYAHRPHRVRGGGGGRRITRRGASPARSA